MENAYVLFKASKKERAAVNKAGLSLSELRAGICFKKLEECGRVF